MLFMKLEDSIEEICKKVCQSQNDYKIYTDTVKKT